MNAREHALAMVRMSNVGAEASASIRVEAIRHARDAQASWTDIGDVLGMSKSNAFKRYGRKVGEPRLTDMKLPEPNGDTPDV